MYSLPVNLDAMSSEYSDITGITGITGVTSEGAAWLASAGTYPRSTLSLWEERPAAPLVLPCGTAFDVVNVPAVFGRRMLDRLWDDGPGSGPVAAYRGRILLFAARGTAQRLPSLLKWEEWGTPAGTPADEAGAGRCRSIPPLLCHGRGDAVTVPALVSDDIAYDGIEYEAKDHPRPESRWVVAPDTCHPWLPGPEILLWAAVRAARAATSGGGRISIFPPADQGAKV